MVIHMNTSNDSLGIYQGLVPGCGLILMCRSRGGFILRLKPMGVYLLYRGATLPRFRPGGGLIPTFAFFFTFEYRPMGLYYNTMGLYYNTMGF